MLKLTMEARRHDLLQILSSEHKVYTKATQARAEVLSLSDDLRCTLQHLSSGVAAPAGHLFLQALVHWQGMQIGCWALLLLLIVCVKYLHAHIADCLQGIDRQSASQPPLPQCCPMWCRKPGAGCRR